MTPDDEPTADGQDPMERALREHLEEIRSEPAPKELGSLAEELQRLLNQRSEED